jgi:AraC-like DNA-binding protein
VRAILAAVISRSAAIYQPRVASALGVSVRTLQRRLLSEGTDFQKLVDEVRLSAAMELLRNGDLGLAGVAERVGYGDPKSLRRAFYRWAGKSPSTIRKELRAGEDPARVGARIAT